MIKGPNTLADLFSNLLKFRGYEVGLVYDITKAYNSMKTGLVEKHVRRLWMRMNPDTDDWQLYGFTCVQFGDRPAATLMSIAVEKASGEKANQEWNPLSVRDAIPGYASQRCGGRDLVSGSLSILGSFKLDHSPRSI